MKHKLTLLVVTALSLGLSGCASLKPNTVKAPCGPTAGMTDPCGNRTPINQPDAVTTHTAFDSIAVEMVVAI